MPPVIYLFFINLIYITICVKHVFLLLLQKIQDILNDKLCKDHGKDNT